MSCIYGVDESLSLVHTKYCIFLLCDFAKFGAVRSFLLVCSIAIWSVVSQVTTHPFIRSYVVVSQGMRQRKTSVASGQNPTWHNEYLEFPIEVPESEELSIMAYDKVSEASAFSDFPGLRSRKKLRGNVSL